MTRFDRTRSQSSRGLTGRFRYRTNDALAVATLSHAREPKVVSPRNVEARKALLIHDVRISPCSVPGVRSNRYSSW